MRRGLQGLCLLTRLRLIAVMNRLGFRSERLLEAQIVKLICELVLGLECDLLSCL